MKGVPWRSPPFLVNKRAVRILLECFLVFGAGYIFKLTFTFTKLVAPLHDINGIVCDPEYIREQHFSGYFYALQRLRSRDDDKSAEQWCLHVLHIAKICAENNTCVDVTYARNPSRRLRIGALGENCNNKAFCTHTQETTRFWVTALLGLLPHKIRFFTIFLRRNVVLSP